MTDRPAETRFVVGRREGGKRLDRFLHERIPGLSRTRIQLAIRERVRLDWEGPVRPSTPVRAGGEVILVHRELREERLELEIPVLRRGDGWLAVDKPAGVPVHPVHRVLENSLIRMLRRQLGDDRLRLVHRLDSETTGALLVAATVPASRALSTAFMDGRVHKEYLALVRGEIEGEAGRIDLPIGEARSSRIRVRLAAGHGKPSVTAWRVERRLRGRTLVRLFPETGRRHQLRVHLEALGHPILGDVLYGRPDADYLAMVGGDDPRARDGGPIRQLLHCARMRFDDPANGSPTEVEAPLPEDFRSELER